MSGREESWGADGHIQKIVLRGAKNEEKDLTSWLAYVTIIVRITRKERNGKIKKDRFEGKNHG